MARERELTAGELDRVYSRLIQECADHVESMRTWQDDLGQTCDERGCSVCNADDAETAALPWLDAWMDGDYYARLPFDPYALVDGVDQ